MFLWYHGISPVKRTFVIHSFSCGADSLGCQLRVPHGEQAIMEYDESTGLNIECMNCKYYLACSVCGLFEDDLKENDAEVTDNDRA